MQDFKDFIRTMSPTTFEETKEVEIPEFYYQDEANDALASLDRR